MFWSGEEASAVLAVSGIGMTAYLISSGEKKERWLPLFYFSLMGLLQVLTYLYVDHCILPMNKALTFLGYIHIAFQPIFINMAAMCFIPEEIKHKISTYVYAMCWIGVGCYMLKAYPFSNTYICLVGQEAFCGHWPCTYQGNWHLAWQWPLSNLGSSSPWIDVPPKEYITGEEARTYMVKGNWEYAWQWLRDTLGTEPLFVLKPHIYLLGLHVQTYILCGFILPLLYGSWRMILFVFVFGAVMASLSIIHINEFPAIFSLYSIPVYIAIVKSPLRKYLFVKNWVFYKHILRLVKH